MLIHSKNRLSVVNKTMPTSVKKSKKTIENRGQQGWVFGFPEVEQRCYSFSLL